MLKKPSRVSRPNVNFLQSVFDQINLTLWVWLITGVLFIAIYLLSKLELGGFFTRLFWNVDPEATNASLSEVVRNLGLLAAGFIGLGFGIWRAITAHRQTEAAQQQAFIAEQGHFTDRFNNAVEQLGKPSQAVRIGAIYSLWRLSEDSPARDQTAVWNVLCNFARSFPFWDETLAEKLFISQEQTTILGLFGQVGEAEKRRISGYIPNFEGANFRNLKLIEANLSGCGFRDTNMDLAYLYGTNLDDTDFTGASLEGATLDYCSFRNALLILTRFRPFQSSLPPAGSGKTQTTKMNFTDVHGAQFLAAELTMVEFDQSNNWINQLGKQEYHQHACQQE